MKSEICTVKGMLSFEGQSRARVAPLSVDIQDFMAGYRFTDFGELVQHYNSSRRSKCIIKTLIYNII